MRANNIIIFNLLDNTNEDHIYAIDQNKFNNIMCTNTLSLSYSLGRSDGKGTSKPRLLKVFLYCSLEAFTVLRT